MSSTDGGEFALDERSYRSLVPLADAEVDAPPDLPGERRRLSIGGQAAYLDRVLLPHWVGYRLVAPAELTRVLAVFGAWPGGVRSLESGLAAELAPASVARRAGLMQTIIGELARVRTVEYVLRSELGVLRFGCDGPLEFIREFLEPYHRLERAPSAPERAVLRLLGDRELRDLVESLWRSLEASSWNESPLQPRVLCRGEGYLFFELDGVKIGRFSYPRQRDARPVSFVQVADEALTVLYDRDDRDSDHDAARALRAAAAGLAVSRGALALHAAAFADGHGRVHLICGDKRAGKTTNLLAALANVKGAKLVSNDRVFVDGNLIAHGSPHSIPVRQGALRANARLLETVAGGTSLLFAGRDRGYANGLRTDAEGSEQELYFGPRELAAQLGIEVSASGRLGTIIVPQRDPPGPAGERWRRLDPAQTGELVERNLHHLHETAAPFWNELLPRPDLTTQRLLVERIAARPVWRLCSYGDLDRCWALAKDLLES